MKTTHRRVLVHTGFVLTLVLLVPSWAAAQKEFTRIVVFGTSLSDPGNAFALIGENSTPPYSNLDQFLVPDRPYAKGGNHFSNGATWIEQFARPLGLAGNARPAFRGSGREASNYAVGGARASDTGLNVPLNILSTQVNMFLADYSGTAPSEALYVIEIGGDDIRDAVALKNPGIIQNAITAIGQNVTTLYSAGARKFLIWNAPDIGLTPALSIAEHLQPGAIQLATGLSLVFNSGLDGLLLSLSQLTGIQITKLDIFALLHAMVSNPGAFDLNVVNRACIMPNTPPFECKMPDGYLFWDGIHPTKAVNAIVAQAAAMALTGN